MSTTIQNRKQLLLVLSLTVVTVLLVTQSYALAVAGQSKTAGPLTTASGSGKTISVSGTGEIHIQPDTALVTIGTVTQATTADAAVQQNANIMTAVISGLNGIGIDNTNIQTVQYYIYPVYNSASPPTITGYQVTNQIQVTVVASGQSQANLGPRIGQVIDTAASNGANQSYGVQFTASSDTYKQAQKTALSQAAKNASEQAHIIATALDLTITGVVSVSNGPSYYPPVYAYTYANALAASSTPIAPPQSLTVSATIQAVFAIA